MPFPETPQERAMTGDPRPSIAERYANAAAYQKAIGEAARKLVAAGHMIEEDVERCITAAANWHSPLHDVKLDR